MNVTVEIDRLVLEGIEIAPGERPLLATAVVTELTRLLHTHRLPHAGSITLRSVPTTPIHVGADNKGTQLGQQIGRAVHGGLNQQ